jgi:hypothetical protein
VSEWSTPQIFRGIQERFLTLGDSSLSGFLLLLGLKALFPVRWEGGFFTEEWEEESRNERIPLDLA